MSLTDAEWRALSILAPNGAYYRDVARPIRDCTRSVPMRTVKGMVKKNLLRLISDAWKRDCGLYELTPAAEDIVALMRGGYTVAGGGLLNGKAQGPAQTASSGTPIQILQPIHDGSKGSQTPARPNEELRDVADPERRRIRAAAEAAATEMTKACA